VFDPVFGGIFGQRKALPNAIPGNAIIEPQQNAYASLCENRVSRAKRDIIA
jgi:hypothetical protein